MALKHEFKTQGDFLFKYRSYLPVFIILIGMYVFLQSLNISPENNSNQFSRIQLICLCVSVLGLLIRIYTIGYSADNTSGRNTSEGQIASTVNNSGIYSIVRHPLYVGNFFMWVGFAGLAANLWFLVAFILFYWLYYERIMYAEETFLIDTYGEAYTDWAETTPAFIPKLSNWRPPALSFSWIKVIRQEKAGILNLCIVFFLFNILGQWYTNGSIIVSSNYWFILLLVGMLWYVIIKTIQKTSGILNTDR